MSAQNDLSVLMPIIGPLAQDVLRERGFLFNVVNTDFSSAAASAGDLIRVTFPVALGVGDVVPGPTSSVATAITPTSKDIQMDTHRFAQFSTTAKQEQEIENPDGFIAKQLQEGIRAVVNDFESNVYTAMYASCSSASSSWGIGGSLSGSLANIVTLEYRLDDALAPASGRTLVVGSGQAAHISNNTTFNQVNTAGTGETLREGRLGRIHGFDVMKTQNIPSNQYGSGSSALAFQRGAVGVAARVGNTVGDTIFVQDPASGFPISITRVDGEFQRKWMVSGMWGMTGIYPQWLNAMFYNPNGVY